MGRNELNDILQTANSLNELALYFFGKKNYNNREKIKKLLTEYGIIWEEWIESKKRTPNICLFCGKEISGKDRFRKKFCNSSCAASYNNTHRKHLTDEVKIKISKTLRSKSQTNSKRSNIYLSDLENKKQRICANCGKGLSNTQMKFCSQSCAGAFKYNKYIESWKKNEVNGLSGKYNLNKYIRRFLLEKHNFQCEKCGWGELNEYTNTIPLEIHHIDGNYTNNKEENLQVLCPNCHSLTSTYKSHNKNGRKKRKKYN